MTKYTEPRLVVATQRGYYGGDLKEPGCAPFGITDDEHFTDVWMRDANDRDLEKLRVSRLSPFERDNDPLGDGAQPAPVGPDGKETDLAPPTETIQNPTGEPKKSRRTAAPRASTPAPTTLTEEEMEAAQEAQRLSEGDEGVQTQPDSAPPPPSPEQVDQQQKGRRSMVKTPPTVGVAGKL